MHYKIGPDDHSAKFRGDRPMELGDLWRNQKKTSRVKQKAFRNYRSGRPKNSLFDKLLFDAAMLIRLSKNSLCTIGDT